MSELPQNRPVARDKLSAALKRNMARRKAAAAGGKSVEAGQMRARLAEYGTLQDAEVMTVPAAKGGAV